MPTYRVIVERVVRQKAEFLVSNSETFREASTKAHKAADEMDEHWWNNCNNKVEKPKVTHIYLKKE